MTYREALGIWKIAPWWLWFSQGILTKIQVQLSQDRSLFLSLIRSWVNNSRNPGSFHLFTIFYLQSIGLVHMAQDSWLHDHVITRGRGERGKDTLFLFKSKYDLQVEYITSIHVLIARKKKKSHFATPSFREDSRWSLCFAWPCDQLRTLWKERRSQIWKN